MTSSYNELREALVETLEHRGVLNQLKARVRSEVFKALDDKDMTKPTLSNQNLIINELIREYLAYNIYQYTLAVFTPETNQPEDPLDRDFIKGELRLSEDINSSKIPLLYGLTFQQASERDKEFSTYSENLDPYLRRRKHHANRDSSKYQFDSSRPSSRGTHDYVNDDVGERWCHSNNNNVRASTSAGIHNDLPHLSASRNSDINSNVGTSSNFMGTHGQSGRYASNERMDYGPGVRTKAQPSTTAQQCEVRSGSSRAHSNSRYRRAASSPPTSPSKSHLENKRQ